MKRGDIPYMRRCLLGKVHSCLLVPWGPNVAINLFANYVSLLEDRR